ncbi:hypothetical protein [Paraburkholderia rhizosphaerae]|uniref:Uncharacterized protein n=1 Tax=Paraburkholderia rhizosphaerae TaxID=480658 RepID=A0A4R8LQU6_9BURK|nr:hypothetical protein [Paraburkholderia rhizosphaerae]TDY48250.1 hypothetical protein BX592_111185 [Paraburkholderia rhizosphaerae]
MTDHTVDLAAGTTSHFPFVGHNEPALLKILRAAVIANPAVLDRPFFCSADHSDFLDFLASASSTGYRDVPVHAVMGTQHKNGFDDARNWRDALAALKGENTAGEKWDDRALAYIESELVHQPFPCDALPGTTLQLVSWGGAVFSDNGAHRLIAAVCWLSAKHGADAMLRQAHVTYRPLHSAPVMLMASAARGQQDIAYGRHGFGWLIRVGAAPAARYVFLAKEGGAPQPVKRRDLWSVLRGDSNGDAFDSPTDDPLNLKRLPPELALALADETWLEQ